MPTDIGYTSQREDTSTNLMFYNARYYSPLLGRFLSPDIMVPNPHNPQAFNRYAYTLNNPMRFTDPTGHFTEEELAKYLGFEDVDALHNWDAWGQWQKDNSHFLDMIRQPDFTFGSVLAYTLGSSTQYYMAVQDSDSKQLVFWNINNHRAAPDARAILNDAFGSIDRTYFRGSPNKGYTPGAYSKGRGINGASFEAGWDFCLFPDQRSWQSVDYVTGIDGERVTFDLSIVGGSALLMAIKAIGAAVDPEPITKGALSAETAIEGTVFLGGLGNAIRDVVDGRWTTGSIPTLTTYWSPRF